MELLKKLWSNPQHRKIIILSALILILLITIIIQLMQIEEPPPEGAMRVVICKQCNAKYVTRIKDINDQSDPRNICKKCKKGRLTFVIKCDECQFEYPEPDMGKTLKKLEKTMDKFQAIVESRRCPNCSSLATHPYSVKEFRGGKVERDKINVKSLRTFKH